MSRVYKSKEDARMMANYYANQASIEDTKQALIEKAVRDRILERLSHSTITDEEMQAMIDNLNILKEVREERDKCLQRAEEAQNEEKAYEAEEEQA